MLKSTCNSNSFKDALCSFEWDLSYVSSDHLWVTRQGPETVWEEGVAGVRVPTGERIRPNGSSIEILMKEKQTVLLAEWPSRPGNPPQRQAQWEASTPTEDLEPWRRGFQVKVQLRREGQDIAVARTVAPSLGGSGRRNTSTSHCCSLIFFKGP